MSWLFPRVYDRLTAGTEEACFQAWRADLLGGIHGEVLEVGAGTGNNLGHYPPTVSRLVLTDPEPAMLDRLRPKLGRLDPAVPVEIQAATLEHLPFTDRSFDVVVATLVLCSVPDQARALAEIARVLRPGGELVFMEHVAAEGRPERLAWQRRIEPIWKRLAGGCHLTRRTADAIVAAGFEMVPESPVRESARKAAPIVRPTVRGRARLAA